MEVDVIRDEFPIITTTTNNLVKVVARIVEEVVGTLCVGKELLA